MAFELPKLPFAHDALEPFIDSLTMQIHHEKHHGAYVSNLNNALQGSDSLNLPIEEIIRNISKYPVAVRNNGGGHFNHSLFWNILSPRSEGQPDGILLEMINSEFGSFEKFREVFTNAAMTRFGSGWAWLSLDKNGKLCVCSTPNQDNPLMDIADCQGTPILGLDVWEHAYYLKYQNRRADYVNAFWNIINWNQVKENFNLARK
ncbi:MAG TPA: superoxide dismutase [Bacteroidia bacterium]|nr:superoxide dismutase [Bacteroidia bacterium]HRS58233.1 superoxide dismutase [Bacteroidia bacterium]HRU68646.1 superoxide dismutase [Bacteroidia bacterium]